MLLCNVFLVYITTVYYDVSGITQTLECTQISTMPFRPLLVGTGPGVA